MGRGKPRKGRGLGAGHHAPRAPHMPEGRPDQDPDREPLGRGLPGCGGAWYRVSFAGESPTCRCSYHATGKGCRCRHMAAVEHDLPMSSEAALGRKVGINEHEPKCPGCKKRKYARDGWYTGKHEKRRRCRCAVCGRQFRDIPGLEYRRVPRPLGRPNCHIQHGTSRALSTAGCRACTSRWP